MKPGKRYAYCSKCKSNQPFKYMGIIEGSREKVKCSICKRMYWIGGGYGH